MINSFSKSNVRTVYFDGNSLMNYSNGNLVNGMRFSQTAYSAIIASKPCAMQNYSVGGRSTTQMITDFATNIAPYIRPNDIVFIWEIGNDLAIPVSDNQAYVNIQTMAGLVRGKQAKAVVGSTIPSQGPRETNKLAVDALIRANWPTFADEFMDFRALTHFQVAADSLDSTYFNADGTHLTTLGYDTLAAAAATKILSIM